MSFYQKKKKKDHDYNLSSKKIILQHAFKNNHDNINFKFI